MRISSRFGSFHSVIPDHDPIRRTAESIEQCLLVILVVPCNRFRIKSGMTRN